MRFFCNLTIRTKLMILVACTAILMIAVGVTGLVGLHASNKVAESIYKDRLVAIDQLNSIRNYQMQSRMNLLAARQESDPFEIMAWGDKVRSTVFKIEQILAAYRARKPVGEEKRLFDEFVAARVKFGTTSLMPMIDLLQTENFAEADKLRKEQGDPLYAKVSAAIDNLIDYQTKSAQQDFDAAMKRAHVVQAISIGALLLGVGLSVSLGIFLTRGINRGVSSLQQAAVRLAAGDLTTRVNSDRSDEIGTVAKSFDSMTDQFAGIVREVSRSSHNVGATATELSNVADQVAASSRQQSDQAAQAAASIETLNAAFKDIAATAEEMSAKAEQLQQTMSFFKLEASAMASRVHQLAPKSAKPVKRAAAVPGASHSEPNETDFVKF